MSKFGVRPEKEEALLKRMHELGIREEDITAGVYVRYTRDAQQALEAVRAKGAQVALLLNATRGRQVRDVALADERMPHKSTYYYPKLITGLVMNPLW